MAAALLHVLGSWSSADRWVGNSSSRSNTSTDTSSRSRSSTSTGTNINTGYSTNTSGPGATGGSGSTGVPGGGPGVSGGLRGPEAPGTTGGTGLYPTGGTGLYPDTGLGWIQAGSSCLVLGQRSVARTSLLFQAAAAAAEQRGGRVLFLAPRPIQALPAALLPLEPRCLRRVELVYPHSVRDVLHTLASLHQNPGPPPSLLLLDGADEMLAGGGRDVAGKAALLAALLRDSAAWATQVLGPSTPCQLIVALQTQAERESAADLGLQVMERYFPVRCRVNEQQSAVAGAQSFRVSFSGLEKSEAGETNAPRIPDNQTWELLCDADNISQIRRVTGEERGGEVAQGTWGPQEGRGE
ncbi:uncharacterized protein LOC129714428 [Leucoraja erinacea]|uniref:uncharacterized protein LOC129714428 n=1 Tax=Leucoraja erinaceus TaxID=7782 RepID=UPI002458AEE9|nr:uncharacterized protein LOC129714428 [Leucoraja erinacea]